MASTMAFLHEKGIKSLVISQQPAEPLTQKLIQCVSVAFLSLMSQHCTAKNNLLDFDTLTSDSLGLNVMDGLW